MKIIVLLLTTAILQVSASSFAQKITLSEREAPLERVFKQIRNQSGYDFIFTNSTIKGAVPVSIQVKDADLEEVLKQIFASQPLEYVIGEKSVVIKEKTPSFLDRIIDHFAAVDVRGRVLDEAGNPLVGATIQVKGKALAYKTNDKGEFEIKGVDEDAVLFVSYVGYKTLEISLKDAVMPLEIKLNVATGELEEVKVVYNTGYQELNKERATGSFVQIDNELINRSVSTNILDRLKGITSGLNFGSARGGGGNQNIIIRGNSTIEANSSPLIVVDGFPYDESSNNVNILNNINPNDVESITVLKDAAAASIWGVRAGNGVIVIKTKKGKYNQQPIMSANSNVSILQKPDLNYLPIMSSADVIEYEKLQFGTGYWNEYDDSYPSFNFFPSVSQGVEILLAARKKNKNTPGYNALNDQLVIADLDALSKNNIKDDINKYLIQNGISQQYNLNVSGGGERINYRGSIGYDKNKTTNVGDISSRITFRLDNTFKITNKLEAETFIVYTHNKNNNDSFPYGSLLLSSPYQRLIDEKGNPVAIPSSYRKAYLDTASYPALLDWHLRPLDELKNSSNIARQFDIRLGGALRYKIIKGLNANVSYQYEKGINNNEYYLNKETYSVRNLVNQYMSGSPGNIIYPIPYGAILERANSITTKWNLRGQANYNQKWENHEITLLTGAEAREFKSTGEVVRFYNYDIETGSSSNNMNFESSFQLRPNGGSVKIPNATRPSPKTTSRFISYYANGAYTFQQKYTLSASARLDGTNFFGIKANQRVVPLWSSGLLWNISKEPFYNVNWLPDLKLRITYGYNGNVHNGVAAYPTIEARNPGIFNLHQGKYGSLVSAGNPQLRWEKIKIVNFGIDFSSKDQLISGTIEGYLKKGIDLIGPIFTEPTTGISSYTGNGASIKGEGVDLTLNTRNVDRSFKWHTNFLLSYTTDKVIAYRPGSTLATAASSYLTDNGGGSFIGNPLNSLFSYKWAGLDPVNGNPRIYIGNSIKSYTESTTATLEDLVYNGSRNPKFFGSIRNNFSYKNISASFNISYKLDYSFRRNSINYSSLVNTGSGHSDFSKRWRETGDEEQTNVPSLILPVNSTRDVVYSMSDIFIERGDHIRLQDIRLSYDLNNATLKRLPFRNMSLFIYANNLGILWKANNYGIDPDNGDTNIPIQKSLAFGLTITF